MAANNMRSPRNQHGASYDAVIDIFADHMKDVKDILKEQQALNMTLSNGMTEIRTRLDDTIKVLAWIAGSAAALAIAVIAGIIVFWLTHPQ